MIKEVRLETTDNRLVAVAIGYDEGDGFYVQTTDLGDDTHLSESIQDNLSSKEHALAIAKVYQDKYGLALFDWTAPLDVPPTAVQTRVIDQMKEWDKDRLLEELKSFILETNDLKLENLFFDDIATEEEHTAGYLQK